MNHKKISPNFWTLLKIFIPVYIISSIIFYLMIGIVWPPSLIHYLVIAGWSVVTIIYLVLAIKKTHYEITKHEIIHFKGGTKLYYPFKDIIFIDHQYSNKKTSIRFFTSQGDERYLLHDRKRILYSVMLERATNLRALDDIKRQFPKLKI